MTDNWLGAHQVLPSPDYPVFETGPLLLIAGYRGLFAILGCHLAARMAPAGQPRIRYALALGALLLAMNLVGAPSLWGRVPVWYSLSGIALTIPVRDHRWRHGGTGYGQGTIKSLIANR